MKYFIYSFLFLFLSNCKLQEPFQEEQETISYTTDSISYTTDSISYDYSQSSSNQKNQKKIKYNTNSEIITKNADITNNEINTNNNNIQNNIDIDSTIVLNNNNYGIMYHIKYDTMFVGVPKKIKFIISKKLLKKIRIKHIFQTTDISKIKIHITNNIRVNLIDPLETNFKINYIGSDTKQHLDSSITTWMWWVTPLTKGNNHLILYIDIFVDGTNQTIKRYDDNIIVISNDTIINIVIRFLETYWQWIIGTFILPFSVFIWKKKRKKTK